MGFKFGFAPSLLHGPDEQARLDAAQRAKDYASSYQGGDYQRELLQRGNLAQQQRSRDILTQTPGYVPGSEYMVNFGLGQRGGPGVQQQQEQMNAFNQGLVGNPPGQGDPGVGNALLGYQGLASQLAQAAAGQGPSAAQSQFQSALDQNLRGEMALGQSQAGVSPGAGLRNILEAQGTTTGQAAAQSAALRAQEQQAAQAQLGNVLGGFGQVGLGATGQRLQAAGMGQQVSEQDRQAQLELEKQRLGAWQTQVGSDTQMKGADKALTGKIVGGITQGGGAAAALAHGAEVKGKAKVDGDSEENDHVPAMLSPGEIVLPRTVAQDNDAPRKAAEFVRAIRKHKKMAHGGEVGSPFGRLLMRTRALETRLEALSNF